MVCRIQGREDYFSSDIVAKIGPGGEVIKRKPDGSRIVELPVREGDKKLMTTNQTYTGRLRLVGNYDRNIGGEDGRK